MLLLILQFFIILILFKKIIFLLLFPVQNLICYKQFKKNNFTLLYDTFILSYAYEVK